MKVKEELPECSMCVVQLGCDLCVNGRHIDAVSEYASTCDLCAELTSHSEMTMDEETQLGYCETCTPKAYALGLIRKIA